MPAQKQKACPERSRRGFTLVELLVVITIIAILSVVGITAFTGAQKSARDTKRKSDLRAIKLALELYYQNNGSYPARDWVNSQGSQGGQSWITELNFNYMPNGMPTDPINNGGWPWNDTNGYRYSYCASAGCSCAPGGQFFALVVQLENKQDPDRLEKKDYRWCDGNGLYSTHRWNGSAYVVTSL